MNDTPNQTAEQVIAEAMVNAGAPLMHSRVEESVAAALRANGLLSKGAPSEDDREALIDVVKRNRSVVKRMGDGYPSVAFVTDETIADAILAAGFSRATVTDAATEELDKVTLDRLQELAEERGYDKGFAAGWKSEGRTADLLAPKLRKAQAERDAALAAIERVRAEADAYAEQSDVMEPCGAVAQALRTALDGAPEPETPELFPGTNAALDRLTVRKAAPVNAFCIEHGNFHAVELGDPTCEFEDGFGEPVGGEQP